MFSKGYSSPNTKKYMIKNTRGEKTRKSPVWCKSCSLVWQGPWCKAGCRPPGLAPVLPWSGLCSSSLRGASEITMSVSFYVITDNIFCYNNMPTPARPSDKQIYDTFWKFLSIKVTRCKVHKFQGKLCILWTCCIKCREYISYH